VAGFTVFCGFEGTDRSVYKTKATGLEVGGPARAIAVWFCFLETLIGIGAPTDGLRVFVVGKFGGVSALLMHRGS
jgi:hypothetical protein